MAVPVTTASPLRGHCGGRWRQLLAIVAAAATLSCSPGERQSDFDVIVRGGTVFDGTGAAAFPADVGIRGDRIAAIGDLAAASAATEIDATGRAVAPGFINMLSWATESLLVDGRAMSDVKQGVTLEVMGEGSSMGPLNERMKQEMRSRQGNLRFDVSWTTLGEYLDHLEQRGISPNVASYVGATTLRIHEIGYEDRPASDAEIRRMQELVRQAMREGALGVGSSLIYAPANFADTDELIALVNAAAESGGGYISHIRSEGNRLEEGVQELIKIASLTGAPSEIYHLKASGQPNWHKLQGVFEMIEAAQAAGLRVTANMYPYPASATGLDASMPLWVQEGGHEAWIARLGDPEVSRRVVAEMNDPDVEWENRFVQAGPENILLLGFRNPELRPLAGKTLADVAAMRGTSPAETAVDLVIEDDSRVEVSYFMMSEDNVRRKAARPWISFGSDASAPAAEGVFLESNPHPRAYGTFARVLGKYVRDEKAMSLAEAIRRMTSFPAENLGIRERGRLAEGFYADVVIFDPDRIEDRATFEKPHQYAVGVDHVLVNGVTVIRDSEHTGATPGRVVRGPGWQGWVAGDGAGSL